MFVIIMLLANAAGTPVAVGQHPAFYATAAICEAARPEVIAEVQAAVSIAQPGAKIIESKCVTAESVNKANERQHDKETGDKRA